MGFEYYTFGSGRCWIGLKLRWKKEALAFQSPSHEIRSEFALQTQSKPVSFFENLSTIRQIPLRPKAIFLEGGESNYSIFRMLLIKPFSRSELGVKRIDDPGMAQPCVRWSTCKISWVKTYEQISLNWRLLPKPGLDYGEMLMWNYHMGYSSDIHTSQ